MTELDPKKALAAQRSHEDAKAANSLFQAAGQAAILINGGSSTAILAFAAADKAAIRISPYSLAGALFFFALGVVSGALVIAFQAVSVQRYAVRWQNVLLDLGDDKINRAKRKGYFWGAWAQRLFVVSMFLFFCGAFILSLSLWKPLQP